MEEEPNPDIRPSVDLEADDDDAPRRLICVDNLGQPLYDDEIPTANEDGIERDCRDAKHPQRLAHWLKFMRRECGTSKECVAMQMSKSVRDITVMEKGEDSDLRFVDVARYLEAIGMSCSLRLLDFTLHGKEQERRLIVDAARSLSALRQALADRQDRRLTQELDRFLGQTLTKLLLTVHDEVAKKQEIFVCGIRIERVPYHY